jgi:hypothetical protein
VSSRGTLSQNEITGDREELAGRIDNTSWSDTSTRQALNPPHFTSLGVAITPDQAIQSDPLVILSIMPSDKVWDPSMNPELVASANWVPLTSTFVALTSSTFILILLETVLRLSLEGSGSIGWNEA